MDINKYFDENWRWENYKVFFSIQIFRYFVLWFSVVPVIAGVVMQFPTPFTIFVNDTKHLIDLTLPFNWQLLWISSLCFVISLLIHKLRCPSFIQKYNSYSDYLSYSHDHRWLAWEAKRMWEKIDAAQKRKFVARLTEKKYLRQIANETPEAKLEAPQVKEKETVSYFEFQNCTYSLSMPQGTDAEQKEEVQISVFHEIFGRYSASNKYARWAILILLVVSLVLFLIVLIEHILTGGRYVLDWLV